MLTTNIIHVVLGLDFAAWKVSLCCSSWRWQSYVANRRNTCEWDFERIGSSTWTGGEPPCHLQDTSQSKVVTVPRLFTFVMVVSTCSSVGSRTCSDFPDFPSLLHFAMFGGPFGMGGMGGMMGGMGGMAIQPVLVTRGGQPMGVVAVPVGMGPVGPMGAPFPAGDDILLEALRRQLRDDSPSPRGDSSACLELYHETSPEAAASILRSQRMYRGSDGLAGGGIYFAESPSEARRKAHQHGAMLRATVRVGRMKVAHVALRGNTEHVQPNSLHKVVCRYLAGWRTCQIATHHFMQRVGLHVFCISSKCHCEWAPWPT